MKARIWSVIEEPDTDEGSYTRLSFDNQEAAEAFIEEVHRLEYVAYLDERKTWGVVPDDGLPYKTIKGPDNREMRAYVPPPAVDYDHWIKRDFNLIPSKYGESFEGSVHVYDEMHSPSDMHVRAEWLHGDVPDLVSVAGVIRTVEEQENLEAIFANNQKGSTHAD